MKKVMLVVIMLAIFVSILFADGIQPPGSGTSENPYQISILEHLLWISTNTGSWYGYYFIQIADIDATPTSGWNGGAGFLPIGRTNPNSFTGSYNGQNHTIDGLLIHRSASWTGMFGIINWSIISNLTLTNVDIFGRDQVGGLVGYNNGSFISNCSVTGSVSGSDDDVGGLVGNSHTNSTVSNCSAAASVYGSGDEGHVGGLVGNNQTNSIISNSYSTGFVSCSSNAVGGLVGISNSADIHNCYSTGSVNGGISNIGGLVGVSYNSDINNCYATGSVNGNNNNIGGLVGNCFGGSSVSYSYCSGDATGYIAVGGLVGYIENIILSNNYCSGDVTRTYGSNTQFGGYCGYNSNSTIEYCYSTGSVSYTGADDPTNNGFVGNNIDGTYNNNFYDIDTSGQSAAIGAIGKTTVEMKNIRTFTDVAWSDGLDSPWDFFGNPYDDTGNEDDWNMDICTNDGYPFLSWQFGYISPDVPTNLIITISGDDVELTWDNSGAATYNIYRSTDPYEEYWDRIGSVVINSYTDVGAGLEMRYFYYVTVCD